MNASQLPAIGTSLAGGFYAGRFQIAGKHFALIVSPAAGDIEGAWGEYGKKLDGCCSMIDGKQNTIDLAESGSELARTIMLLDINGFNDWFLPARDQLELLYRNLKPTDSDNWCSYLDGYNANSVPPGDVYDNEPPAQTAAADFQAGAEHAVRPEWYWSSTQFSARFAFCQTFDDGYQGTSDKYVKLRARAVRMIQLSN